MSMATHVRLLMVCRRCWDEAFPSEAPRVGSVHSLEDCFVCQQNRGIIYVTARIEWGAQDRTRCHG